MIISSTYSITRDSDETIFTFNRNLIAFLNTHYIIKTVYSGVLWFLKDKARERDRSFLSLSFLSMIKSINSFPDGGVFVCQAFGEDFPSQIISIANKGSHGSMQIASSTRNCWVFFITHITHPKIIDSSREEKPFLLLSSSPFCFSAFKIHLLREETCVPPP